MTGVRWLTRSRPPLQRPEGSRAFTDDLLASLAGEGYGLGAWGRLLERSLQRSAEEARRRPVAAIEIGTIGGLLTVSSGSGWALATAGMAITHLGLLGDRRTLGFANRVTLFRALLPGLLPSCRAAGVVALLTDVLDGRIAAAEGPTAFGAYADTLADVAFWWWFGLRWERDPHLRWAPVITLALPAAAVTTLYFIRGRTVDYPRPVAYRWATGATQVALALRALRS